MSIRPWRDIQRKKTRKIKVGNVYVGGDAPISVQSMTNTLTTDEVATTKQILALENAGADLVRVSCPDEESTKSLKKIIKNVNVPIIADIHFHYKRALESADAGVACLRINPGNIGKVERVKEVVKAAKENNCAIRIGVNAGSLERDLLEKYGYPSADALVESAERHLSILDELDFKNVKVSVKSSNVNIMIDAYRKLAKKTDVPFHLGVTESGTYEIGSVKSSIGIGSLISEGIGDTIRVSLTDDPVKEVKMGKNILKALGHFENGIELITCPGCGRLEIDLQSLVEDVEKRIEKINSLCKSRTM